MKTRYKRKLTPKQKRFVISAKNQLTPEDRELRDYVDNMRLQSYKKK